MTSPSHCPGRRLSCHECLSCPVRTRPGGGCVRAAGAVRPLTARSSHLRRPVCAPPAPAPSRSARGQNNRSARRRLPGGGAPLAAAGLAEIQPARRRPLPAVSHQCSSEPPARLCPVTAAAVPLTGGRVEPPARPPTDRGPGRSHRDDVGSGIARRAKRHSSKVETSLIGGRNGTAWRLKRHCS